MVYTFSPIKSEGNNISNILNANQESLEIISEYWGQAHDLPKKA